jgi:DNA repair exonuclease SbcCD ATPase subunit
MQPQNQIIANPTLDRLQAAIRLAARDNANADNQIRINLMEFLQSIFDQIKELVNQMARAFANITTLEGRINETNRIHQEQTNQSNQTIAELSKRVDELTKQLKKQSEDLEILRRRHEAHNHTTPGLIYPGVVIPSSQPVGPSEETIRKQMEEEERKKYDFRFHLQSFFSDLHKSLNSN